MDNEKKDFVGLIVAFGIIVLYVVNLIFDIFDFQIDNENPVSMVFLVTLLIGGGVGFVLKGVNGIRNEKIVWKHYSNPMYGKAAQTMGFLYVFTGILLLVTSLVLVLVC